MENRRNSGSYSSRVAIPPQQPTQQPPPDGYPQKRSSYRRPVDPQSMPASTQPQQVPSNTISSNSARPVAAVPSANGVSRASSHRRRQSQQLPPTATATRGAPDFMPAAPDVPRGPPPTAYRDPYAPKGSSRSSRGHSSRSRDPTIHSNSSRQQPSIQTGPNRLQELRAPPYAPVEPMSGGALGGAQWDAHRRPSVPERSPLQKLEGKLDDISKEEKRARILEIELAKQEKIEAETRARRAQSAAKQQRIVSGPVSGAAPNSSAPNRTRSTRSTIRHVSMPVQTKPSPNSPELGELDGSGDRSVHDINDPWDPSTSAPQRTQSQSKDQRLSSGSFRHNTRLSRDSAPPSRIPSVKGKEPAGSARETGSFRARSGVAPALDGAQRSAQRVDRKPVPGPGPTGLGLYEVDDAPHASRSLGDNVSRYDSKRLSKDLPPTPKDPNANSSVISRGSRGISAAQKEMEQQKPNQNPKGFDHVQPQPYDPPVANSATRRSVGFAASDSDSQAHASHETHSRHSVPDVFSHQEPDRRYIAPPMLDEWRTSPLGALFAEDLDLDTPDRSNGTGKNAWWEEGTSSRRRRSGSQAETGCDGYVDERTGQTSFKPPLYLKCGPLLRYTGLRRDKTKTGKEREIWRGSVMIVTIDEQSSYQKPPVLRMFKQSMDLLPPPPAEVDADDFNPAYVDPIEGQIKVSRSGKTLYVKPIDEIEENEDLSRVEDDSGLFQATRITPNVNGQKTSRIQIKDGERLGKMRDVPGVRLHAERGVTFWRFNLEIELGSQQARIAYRINRGPAVGFWVPGKGETMNIMFHSCNGFSLSVNSKEFCGPDPMWRDVLNNHQTRPFHVMLGGGDQIYNDAVMRETTLFKQWTESKNPLQKHNASFSSELQNELEQFYLDRYSMWFSQGMFGMATSQIPMVNIWDDHDIIDGFGSYPHHFMSTPVFTGLGAVAFKYYMLFQHQSVAAETEKTEPSWILGAHPGPYIREQSRSIFLQLGRQVAFLGLDCRTERQRDEILTEDSYDVIFDRLEKEIIKGETKHLLVLLGVPIAYPRLNFLENILTSKLMDPIKALGRAGLLGNFVNKFDGGVEILDDLDDHWTAKHHKDERNWFVRELQHIASTKSVRVTILGGDVHLAAIGQFFSNKKLNIPKDKDHRYMPNVVSSAIVNTPPPEMMADILNKRNKIHHLDPNTDENMIPIFTHDSDGKKRNNLHLLPRRNWCSLREYKPGTTPSSTPSPPSSPGPRLTRTLSDYAPGKMVRRLSGTGNNNTGNRGRDSGPPVAYYNNPVYAEAAQPQSSFSPDREERPRSRRNSLTSLFRRRTSVDNVNAPGSTHSMPVPQNRNSMAPPERPTTFHRRASVLSKKHVLAQGEFIDLQGGLDICLNLEVSQKDPAGITTPYRLLVPALHYTPDEHGVVEKPRRKSRGVFSGVFGSKKKRIVGDDGYSQSGSDESRSGSDVESEDDEEGAKQRYRVGPRVLLPSMSRKRDSVNPPDVADTRGAGPPIRDQRQSVDVSASRSVPQSQNQDRHVSAPVPPMTSQTIPTRSGSMRQPTYNSSHKSQLPAPATAPATAAVPDAKVNRRSMGGILNQDRGPEFERDAHVATHTPARSKRESYPPHPAIVGTGLNSPYSRGTVEARNDTGGYFASRNGGGGAPGSVVPVPNAGVGAKYLGGGRYADDDISVSDVSESDHERGGRGGGRGGGRRDDRSYSGESVRSSVDSFVPPKKPGKWKIWK
ncbi:hypothetical protein K504DRAFT_388085 [Pleomassaria siparia CBS 279.74]|uniref:PhoD-like phosphatase domain-containing protein n=1 Tax=Pleomassaria siparia CBS 279.74 TaxID=1314801 RepID=A0A6G1JXW4_9PLEO|nr:hypothetical protein K504DRAFT_388085 [Pleomassaria siparia CBS 279.74]